ncbi:MAG: chemotaxis protein CheW [Planctomycetota bacterium]|nr:chemotaxis protein CheW [Planctomycetota bacterium]
MSEAGARGAAGLRRAFDAAFAAEPGLARAAGVKLLTLAVHGDRYAVRLEQAGGVARCGALTPLPSRAPALLGLAGLRGEALPVFSLALLLGYPSAEPARWLLLGAAPAQAGLALGDFEGCVEADPEAFVQSAEAAGAGRSGMVVRLGPHAHTLLDAAALFASLRATKERY